MTKLYSILSAMFLLVAVACNPAYAQVACGPTEGVHDLLTEEYGEVPKDSREVDGIQYEFWMNADTGTYSVLGYPEPDTACLIDSGLIAVGTSV